MNGKRKVELFSAGCQPCREAEELVRRMSCPSCEVQILSMKDPLVATRARKLGIQSVPAVAVDGTLAACCARRGPNEKTLRAIGVGTPLP